MVRCNHRRYGSGQIEVCYRARDYGPERSEPEDTSCTRFGSTEIAGISSTERLDLKQLYRALFRSGMNLREAIAAAQGKFSSGSAKVMLDFLASSKRGVCADSGAKERVRVADEE